MFYAAFESSTNRRNRKTFSTKVISSQCCRFILTIVVSFSLINPVQADLVGWWKFDGDITDSSGNGNDGALLGGSYSDDIPDSLAGGQSVKFTGQGGEGAEVPDSSSLDITAENGGMSVAAWVKKDNLSQFHFIVHKGSSGAAPPNHAGNYEFRTRNNGVLEMLFQRDAGANSTTFHPSLTRLELNQWHHVAATVENGVAVNLYLDGELDATLPPAADFGDEGSLNDESLKIGWRTDGFSVFEGQIDDLALWNHPLTADDILDVFENGLEPPPPIIINGSGETYLQDFDEMGVNKRMPSGWSGISEPHQGRSINSFGLVDGPLESAVDSAAGLVNAGGNAERFSTPADGRLGTWKDDLDGSGDFGEPDIIQDAATDRALGVARVESSHLGSLTYEVEIAESVLRALVVGWDLEVWGGDPEAEFRGADGGGFTADLQVGGTSYYNETVSLLPGELFDSSFDLSPGTTNDPTLINGNEHAIRGTSSGILEVSSADGAVGNLVNLTFDANTGLDSGGWTQAIDNVLIRALAAGDAQADGDVDPADLIQLLAGGAFGQGNIDASWGQGDFDNDGDFDGTDILAVVQGLAGEFPKTYAHDPNNGVPDVLINPATGNITLDTNGTTIGSIVMDSAAGIFNGPNSPNWDAPGDFAADIDTQISMPISFTNPGYTGVDDLGDGIIGDLAPGFDILADLTIKYLDPNGDLLDAEAHVVPEPNSVALAAIGMVAMLGYLRRRRRLG